MSRWDAAKSAERGSTPDRIRAGAFEPQARPAQPWRELPVTAVAPAAQKRFTPSAEAPVESVRLIAADLAPLARPADALIADLSRIEITLSRLGASPQESQSVDMGAEAVREVLRRMRLVITAADALVTGEQ
ncbi:hypothetical protein GCM10007036_43770 [Alsobacter metallidurans]|uniref:Uncharacterized protein n=1 Tax=Alsobacter metallidurans TaxID=340221 RepID=A0A917IBI1_9HYPH|nr:hypothetical protein [Alsobacter metallidurans]GGH32129.1 hypothetical protein GCM10007036_43770 [Alsobacter metallidurans]